MTAKWEYVGLWGDLVNLVDGNHVGVYIAMVVVLTAGAWMVSKW